MSDTRIVLNHENFEKILRETSVSESDLRKIEKCIDENDDLGLIGLGRQGPSLQLFEKTAQQICSILNLNGEKDPSYGMNDVWVQYARIFTIATVFLAKSKTVPEYDFQINHIKRASDAAASCLNTGSGPWYWKITLASMGNSANEGSRPEIEANPEYEKWYPLKQPKKIDCLIALSTLWKYSATSDAGPGSHRDARFDIIYPQGLDISEAILKRGKLLIDSKSMVPEVKSTPPTAVAEIAPAPSTTGFFSRRQIITTSAIVGGAAVIATIAGIALARSRRKPS